MSTVAAGLGAGDTRDLIERLVTVLDDRMTRLGHPYALVQQESLGTCSAWGCSDRCIEYRALFRAGMAWLDAHPVDAAPDQLGLFADEAAG